MNLILHTRATWKKTHFTQLSRSNAICKSATDQQITSSKCTMLAKYSLLRCLGRMFPEGAVQERRRTWAFREKATSHIQS